MSQLEDPTPLSFSIPDKFRIKWKSFVQDVLEVTVQAYQDMNKRGTAKLKWEEDHFTINLEHFIRPLAYQRGLTVVSQIKTYTIEMETGEVSAKQAKVLDLRMWGSWEDYHRVHFAWECKRIADSYEDKNYKDLIPEYIKEGMFRFIDEEYAIGLDDAGILAYVLGGDISKIVDGINQSMQSSQRKRRLSTSEHLELAPPIGTFTHIYQSCHRRLSSASSIRLHHLFLIFNFDQ